MPATANTVYLRDPARFDMTGRKLCDTITPTSENISHGTVARMHRYALRHFADAGFDVSTWHCEVYTMDGDLPRSDRTYAVEFTSPKGGKLSICGIHTSGGHPYLHMEVAASLG